VVAFEEIVVPEPFEVDLIDPVAIRHTLQASRIEKLQAPPGRGGGGWAWRRRRRRNAYIVGLTHEWQAGECAQHRAATCGGRQVGALLLLLLLLLAAAAIGPCCLLLLALILAPPFIG